MWVGKGSLRMLFVYVNQPDISEVAAALYHWCFIDNFFKNDMIMPTKYDINALYLKRVVNVGLIAHVGQGNNKITILLLLQVLAHVI